MLPPTQYAATVSNDLALMIPHLGHQMLTSIQLLKGSIETARSLVRPVDPSLGKYRQYTNEEIDHLYRLVCKMVKLFEYEQTGIKLQLSLTDVQHLLYKTIHPFYLQHRSDFHFSLPHTDSKALNPILIDPSEIQELIRVLLENAIKYTPKGGSISTKVAQNHQATFLIFENTGVGIKPQDIKNLTKPFERHNQEKLGYGLGLSIAYHIVRLHKGQLEIKSDGTHYTCIEVRLPHRRLE